MPVLFGVECIECGKDGMSEPYWRLLQLCESCWQPTEGRYFFCPHRWADKVKVDRYMMAYTECELCAERQMLGTIVDYHAKQNR